MWIGWLARAAYPQGLGHLMAQQVQLAAAAGKLAFERISGPNPGAPVR